MVFGQNEEQGFALGGDGRHVPTLGLVLFVDGVAFIGCGAMRLEKLYFRTQPALEVVSQRSFVAVVIFGVGIVAFGVAVLSVVFGTEGAFPDACGMVAAMRDAQGVFRVCVDVTGNA